MGAGSPDPFCLIRKGFQDGFFRGHFLFSSSGHRGPDTVVGNPYESRVSGSSDG